MVRVFPGVLVALLVVGCGEGLRQPTFEEEFEPGPGELDVGFVADTLDAAKPPPVDPVEPVSIIDHIAYMDVLLDETGRSAALAFDVPADAVSMTLIVSGRSELIFVTDEVIDPNGRVVISPDAVVPAAVVGHDVLMFPSAFFSLNRAYWAPGTAVTMVPNNPDVELVAGRWSVRVAAVDALGWPRRGIVHVRAQIKRSVTATRHMLPLHFYFSGSGGLSAEWAPRDEAFQVSMDVLTSTFLNAGIELGEITLQDIDARWRRVDMDRDLEQLYSLSEYEQGVHVFLVDGIETDTGDVIGGLSGGVPGPAGMPGSPRSGVVVAHTLEPNAERVGLMIAHEVGHYLGLFHAMEMVPGYVDQLPDTPDNDRARLNVMWPVIGAPIQRFTRDQADVLVRGPAVIDLGP